MAKVHSVEAKDSFHIAAQQIETGDFSFFLRTKEQQEYHPKNVGSFTHERYRYAYVIQDMASLVTSNEISHFLSNISHKLRSGKSNEISKRELALVKEFIVKAKDGYKNADYVELESYVGDEENS